LSTGQYPPTTFFCPPPHCAETARFNGGGQGLADILRDGSSKRQTWEFFPPVHFQASHGSGSCTPLQPIAAHLARPVPASRGPETSPKLSSLHSDGRSFCFGPCPTNHPVAVLGSDVLNSSAPPFSRDLVNLTGPFSTGMSTSLSDVQ